MEFNGIANELALIEDFLSDFLLNDNKSSSSSSWNIIYHHVKDGFNINLMHGHTS